MNEENKAPVRIRRIMPLPAGYTVLTPIADADGKMILRDTHGSTLAYCLALVDGGAERDDFVSLYEMSPDGRKVDDESVLVPERRCGQCGRRMVPAIDAPLEFTVSYSCVCGKTEKTGIVPFR